MRFFLGWDGWEKLECFFGQGMQFISAQVRNPNLAERPTHTVITCTSALTGRCLFLPNLESLIGKEK